MPKFLKFAKKLINLMDLHLVSKFEVIWINISKDMTNFQKRDGCTDAQMDGQGQTIKLYHMQGQ